MSLSYNCSTMDAFPKTFLGLSHRSIAIVTIFSDSGFKDKLYATAESHKTKISISSKHSQFRIQNCHIVMFS